MDGRAVILYPRKGAVHELNRAATCLWKAADGSRSVEELALVLEENFEISAEEAREDVTQFLVTLRSHELIAWEK